MASLLCYSATFTTCSSFSVHPEDRFSWLYCQLKLLSTILTYFLIFVCVWMCFCLYVSVCVRAPGAMFSRWWRFGADRYSEVNLFADLNETNAETLSQAIRAAAHEEPDADGSVLFGQLQGTVVGLRYYTGVVRINQGHIYSSSALIHKGDNTKLPQCRYWLTKP